MKSGAIWIIIAIVAATAVAGVAIWLLATSGGVTVPDLTGKSQAEATSILEAEGLVLGPVTKAPSANIAAGLTVDQDPVAGSEIDKGSAVSVALSSGPATAEVPDVTGKTEAAATEALKTAGFAAETTEQFDTKVPEGVVMAQLPSGGADAYVGSSVGMLVSNGLPDEVKVPDVTSMPENDAKDALAEAGLEAVSVEAANDQVPKGHVAGQDPPAGKEVPLLSEVLIAVSLGEGTATVVVPEVAGETKADAVDAVEAAGLKAEISEAYSSDTDKGLVLAQEPSAGVATDEGSTVALLVSLGPKPSPSPSPTPSPSPSASNGGGGGEGGINPPEDVEQAEVPDVVGLTADDAETAVRGAGLRPVLLKSPSVQTDAGLVFLQLPRPGRHIPKTFPVLMLVSTGPPVQVNPL
jgi:eukaryotic-like serine/threonine-protein kinase